MKQETPKNGLRAKLKNLPWPQRLTFFALFAAVVNLVLFGAVASFFCYLVVAAMGWTPSFVKNAAEGKPTLGNKGRIFVGGLMAVLGGIMLPTSPETAQKGNAIAQKSADTDVDPQRLSQSAASAPHLSYENRVQAVKAEGMQKEKQNKLRIAKLLANVKRLDERDYEGRLVFWHEIVSLAPANTEYTRMESELTVKAATLASLKENPEQGMHVEKIRWRKSGFGNVMVVDFTLRNDSLSRLKDFRITCDSQGNSGTDMDSNTRILYEVVEARKTKTFRNVNMGLINSQVATTSCRVDEASIA